MTLIKSQKKDIYCELQHQNVTIESYTEKVQNGNGPDRLFPRAICSISRCPQRKQCPYLK